MIRSIEICYPLYYCIVFHLPTKTCVIVSRDQPTADVLKVKIMEESGAIKQSSGNVIAMAGA